MDYSKLDGLILAVIQDAETSEVLMVGFMNEEELALTGSSVFATLLNSTRNNRWKKTEHTVNKLAVNQISVDCDDDTVRLNMKRLSYGNMRHTDERTCFYREMNKA